MEKTREELIDYLENYNRHRLYTILDGELGRAIGQCLDIIKTIGWQPMETAPKDREFLGVYWPHTGPSNETFAVFRYDEQIQKFAFSDHSGNLYMPSINFTLFAWMEIHK